MADSVPDRRVQIGALDAGGPALGSPPQRPAAPKRAAGKRAAAPAGPSGAPDAGPSLLAPPQQPDAPPAIADRDSEEGEKRAAGTARPGSSQLLQIDEEVDGAGEVGQVSPGARAATGAAARVADPERTPARRWFGRRGATDADDDRAAEQNEQLSVEDRLRMWELSLSLRAYEYVGKVDKLNCFFAVTVCPENERVKRGRVRLMTEYTPAWTVRKGRTRDEQRHSFESPLQLYDRKMFRMSYKTLHKHVLKVDLWKFSLFTYNSFYGSGKKSLAQVAMTEAFMDIKIKQNFTLKEKADQQKKRINFNPPDVAVFCCTCLFEEVFDFSFSTENWTFELSDSHGDYERLKQEKKMLSFVMPNNFTSNASSRKACSVRKTDLSRAEMVGSACRFFWSGPSAGPVGTLLREVKFRGTQSALQSSYFTVALYSFKQGIGEKLPSKVIGRALFGLTSVLDVSVFKGKLKALVTDDQEVENFTLGSLYGTARCVERSINISVMEDIPGGRPRQPRSERTISNISKKEMHLVVRVAKAEGLAVGDANTGSSDPYVRIIWDNMVQRSAVIRATLRPVFNQSFYFPVRFFDPRVFTSLRYREKALPLELESKGAIKIQLWDEENTSADYLGGTKVELKSMLDGKPFDKRSLLGAKKPVLDDDGEMDAAKMDKKKQWFEREEVVRVYDGFRTEAEGCSLPQTTPTFIYFEAYFYPDKWPDRINFGSLDGENDDQEAKTWNERAAEFETRNAKFAATYALAFPDSIGGMACRVGDASSRKAQLRRFPCLAQHPQTRYKVPLMAFLARITTPQDYSRPPVLLHWMNCIMFFSMKVQESTGTIPDGGWKDPQTMLSARKGPIQDHAVLLCSILLGSGHDAYVCKGTIRGEGGRLVEHCWVMTRDTETGWVTFWEPCTREIFHLPKRVTKRSKAQLPKRQGSTGELDDEREDEEGPNGQDEEEQVRMRVEVGEAASYEVRDTRLTAEDIDLLPTIGRTPRAKVKARAKPRGKSGREKEKDMLKRQRDKLPQAPNPKLLKPDDTLVDWLPYDSIEVVFNRENLWANHQNHHPAVIMYDLDVDEDRELPAWLPFLSKENRTLHSAEHKIEYICPDDVMMDPELKLRVLSVNEQTLVGELKESIRLFRSKLGKDTNWDPDRGNLIRENVTKFLTIHEEMRKLDKDFCGQSVCAKKIADEVYKKLKAELPEGRPVPKITDGMLRDWLRGGRSQAGDDSKKNKKGSIEGPYAPYEWVMNQLECQVSTNNRYSSAFSESTKLENYQQEQTLAWNNLFSMVTEFRKDSQVFPTKKGKRFRGFPLHFTTSDPLDIQQMLMQNEKYRQEILQNENDEGVLFSVHCKIFGLLGGVQSTWLYFGLQEPLKDMESSKPPKDAEAQAQEQSS